ncbi:cupin domain-containing protein [Haloarcula litorea]|uniref:cupin domain-containing protein n=1 Tax=Haloarcula litorea TaxID=3032579 RepID=UPI0023E87DD0|nr:cupin domain-containing protein [Halomicroarcula sp. GDY20]
MNDGEGGVNDAEPLVFEHGMDESGEKYVRMEVTLHPGTDTANDDLAHHPTLFDVPDRHVHPKQEERFEVVTGEYAIERDGTQHTLTPGDELVVPPGTPHTQRNPTDDPIRVAHEHRPPLDSPTVYESFYALAQTGQTDDDGMPGPLQTAVVVDEYPGHTYRPSPPVPVQKALFSVLAGVGRLAGYEATHTHDDVVTHG